MSSSNATDIFKYTVILIVNTVYVNMTNKNVHKTLQPPIHKRIKSGTFLMHNFFMGCVTEVTEVKFSLSKLFKFKAITFYSVKNW